MKEHGPHKPEIEFVPTIDFDVPTITLPSSTSTPFQCFWLEWNSEALSPRRRLILHCMKFLRRLW
jgi:hypothetical protein